MNGKWLPKKFKCPHCEKSYPTTYCSNRIVSGKWICKMCNKLFGECVIEINSDEYNEKYYNENNGNYMEVKQIKNEN